MEVELPMELMLPNPLKREIIQPFLLEVVVMDEQILECFIIHHLLEIKEPQLDILCLVVEEEVEMVLLLVVEVLVMVLLENGPMQVILQYIGEIVEMVVEEVVEDKAMVLGKEATMVEMVEVVVL